jgi:hypothetical protein
MKIATLTTENRQPLQGFGAHCEPQTCETASGLAKSFQPLDTEK